VRRGPPPERDPNLARRTKPMGWTGKTPITLPAPGREGPCRKCVPYLSEPAMLCHKVHLEAL